MTRPDGRNPRLRAFQSCADERWGDWRPHLAMILSNTTHRPELNQRAIVTLGDTLGEGRPSVRACVRACVRPPVRPSARPSVRLSAGPSVRPSGSAGMSGREERA